VSMDVLDPTSQRRAGLVERLRTRKGTVAIVAIVLVIALLAARGAHHRRAAMKAAEDLANANSAVAVSVARVTTGDLRVSIPALGTVTPLATVTVKTQIAGQLQKIGFREGQLVHAGDFLAQIDPRPYQAILDQNRGTLRRDEAQLANARLDRKRYEDLIKEDAVSGQQLDQQRALVQQYEGTVEADKAQVAAAAVNLAYTHIVSPVTGRVGLRQVDAGNYVTPGDANGIVVITQLQPITVIAPVPEDEVAGIMRRANTGATLRVDAYDKGNSTLLATGKLLTLDNEIDTTTGTVKLRAIFDNKEGLLFPNQFVNVVLLEDVLQRQTIMPSAAVHRGAPNGVVTTFVYLVQPDSTVAVRPVTLGVQDGERVAVRSGLSVGDLVVTEGGDRLRDHAAVVLPSGLARPADAPVAKPSGAPAAKRTAKRTGGSAARSR